MTRIGDGLSTTLNPSSPQFSAGGGRIEHTPSIGGQVQQALFGRVPPPILDPARFPQLAEQLRILNRFRGRLAVLAGDSADDYDIQLAEGTIAMVDAEGTIYVGAGFLEAYGDKPEVLVGVLAHEIGHRPKRWNQYKTQRRLSQEELHALCRHEETRADLFAGKALAELGMSPEPMIDLLKTAESGPHPDYFPAETRAEVIRDSHAGRSYRAGNRKKLFPAYDRMTSTKGHLGDY